MKTDWTSIVLDNETPQDFWEGTFSVLLDISKSVSSPVAMQNETTVPDRLLSEAAWELWECYPEKAPLTSAILIEWCSESTSKGRAVLIFDALSLRELPYLLDGAQSRNIEPVSIRVTGSECPSTTAQFAKAIGLSSRSAMVNNSKPGTFILFEGNAYTDVVSLPFEDCGVPPSPNLVIWHTWLDDLIHLQKKLPGQVSKSASAVLQSDGFWGFVNKLRQGRRLIITSDHGYAVSKRFSSELHDPEAISILKKSFGASRCKPASKAWQKRFMPPIVMTRNNQHVVTGQWKWKVQGGFPDICHGGMSLLEVSVPFVEFPAI